MPSEVRFAIVRQLFESHGWQLVRIRGSHHVFSKTGRGSFAVPVHHQRVKAAYVKKITQILNQEEQQS
jgi:predicted RNA binding protein YcfA (HicA-like mRNA interferase family)